MFDLRDHILKLLESCPRPDRGTWPPAYERIVGAAFCLAAAYPDFVNRTKDVMDRYHVDVRSRLPELVREAVTDSGAPDTNAIPLKWWACGLYFNTGLSRIANALEKTLLTACEEASVKTATTVRRMAASLHNIYRDDKDSGVNILSDVMDWPRDHRKVDKQVERDINELLKFSIDTNMDVLDILQVLSKDDSHFRRASLLQVWRDANWQKHRTEKARSSVGAQDLTKDPRVQYTFSLRAYTCVIDLFTFLQPKSRAGKS